MNNKRTLIVRIVAIVLAALMVLSLGAVLIQTFAVDGVPITGSGAHSKLPIFILIGAVALVAVCVIVPTLTKKK
ncbi:MAG: hypothetical protein IJT41_08305 [Clostridia bacterium]|nr:hypothetical protein [Clostridia bacterium]